MGKGMKLKFVEIRVIKTQQKAMVFRNEFL